MHTAATAATRLPGGRSQELHMPTVSPAFRSTPTIESVRARRRARCTPSIAVRAVLVGAIGADLVGRRRVRLRPPPPSGSRRRHAPARALPAIFVAAGDTWFGIAERSQVSSRSLLAVNDATVDDMLHPGDVVCLPERSEAVVVVLAVERADLCRRVGRHVVGHRRTRRHLDVDAVVDEQRCRRIG